MIVVKRLINPAIQRESINVEIHHQPLIMLLKEIGCKGKEFSGKDPRVAQVACLSVGALLTNSGIGKLPTAVL